MKVAFFDVLGEATIVELYMKNEGNFYNGIGIVIVFTKFSNFNLISFNLVLYLLLF